MHELSILTNKIENYFNRGKVMLKRAFRYNIFLGILFVVAMLSLIVFFGWLGGEYFDFVSEHVSVPYFRSDVLRYIFVAFCVGFALSIVLKLSRGNQ